MVFTCFYDLLMVIWWMICYCCNHITFFHIFLSLMCTLFSAQDLMNSDFWDRCSRTLPRVSDSQDIATSCFRADSCCSTCVNSYHWWFAFAAKMNWINTIIFWEQKTAETISYFIPMDTLISLVWLHGRICFASLLRMLPSTISSCSWALQNTINTSKFRRT